MKKLSLILAVVGVVAISLVVVFLTFISGRTDGPNLIEAIQNGKITSSTVESIEVVASQVGSMPFRPDEYANLKRLKKIESISEVEHILEALARAERQFPNMNHPVCRDVCYLRINTKNGWYWVYCDLLDDGQFRGLAVDANTLNATNPNGSERYFIDTEEDILAVARINN